MLPNLYVLEYLQRQQEEELRARLLARAQYDARKERAHVLARVGNHSRRLTGQLFTKLWQNTGRAAISSRMLSRRRTLSPTE
ncbi:MAG: hypothetical protein R2932_43175 [Caldilineaceae bacterium]